jgi:transposase
MLYLATDQHGKQLTQNVRNEAGEVIERRQVSTRGDQPRSYLLDLARRSAAEGGFMAIVEVCGFNDWYLDLLRECGCREIVLVQPDRKSRRKTDRRDANALGELLWINRHRLLAGERVQGLRQVRILTPAEREERRLTQLRCRTGGELTRTINTVWAMLRRLNLQHDLPTKGIQTRAARAWLKKLALGAYDRLELDQLLARWDLLREQLDALDNEIARRVADHPAAQLLMSMPGGGAYTSLALAARVGDVSRFPRPRSLANYWGLTPSCHNSGETNDRLGSITKEGSPLARFLLGQMVLHALRYDPVLRRWYKRIKQRRGSKIARVAVMRRLATIVWHLLTKKQNYQVGGPPAKKVRRHEPAEPSPAPSRPSSRGRRRQPERGAATEPGAAATAVLPEETGPPGRTPAARKKVPS